MADNGPWSPSPVRIGFDIFGWNAGTFSFGQTPDINSFEPIYDVPEVNEIDRLFDFLSTLCSELTIEDIKYTSKRCMRTFPSSIRCDTCRVNPPHA